MTIILGHLDLGIPDERSESSYSVGCLSLYVTRTTSLLVREKNFDSDLDACVPHEHNNMSTELRDGLVDTAPIDGI